MRFSLRTKLVASYLLPILLLMPILGLYLLYTLEGFYTTSLLQQLTYQARLIENDVKRNPQRVQNPEAAQAFLRQVGGSTEARVILISENRIILGSSQSEDQSRVGAVFDQPGIAEALGGAMTQGIGPGISSEVAYVVLPLRFDGGTRGALRLSYSVEDVRAQFNQLRLLVLGGVGVIVLLAIAVSLALASTITRPLRYLSEGVQRIASGNLQERVPVQGHDELAALAQGLNQMASDLAAADQARERQLAAIVHEVRRPLSGIQAAIETLHDGADTDPEARETLWMGVEEELTRLERLLNTLQGIHKRALRPMQLNRTTTTLQRVIEATVAHFEPVAARQGVTLSSQVAPGLPPLAADEDRLIQVLTNLLDNALKFTPRGGRISVAAGEDKSGVWVSVTDTGSGIAPQELPYLFQQFYRGDESRPPEKRGMGLGLAISREIIRAHGGDIRVESKPGQGTRFTFHVPRGA